MDAGLEQEYAAAVELLRDRLDRHLIALFDQGDFAESLLRYLQRRRLPILPFDFDNLATIADLAAQLDPSETAWEREIADEAVAGRLYGASNPYCRRFLELDRDSFDFTSHPYPDPETIHGLGRMRWLACLGRTYWKDQDPRYFDALMREWDYFVSRVPFPGEEFLATMHAIGSRGMGPPFGELDIFIRLTNWYWAYWLAVPAAEMTPIRNAVLLARCLRLFDLVAARGIAIQEHNFTSMQMEGLYLWASALPEVQGMTVWKHAARNIMESSLARAVWQDGVQWEKSASYHAGCIRWYGASFLLGNRQGEPWATAYGERLLRMGNFLDAVITPDQKLTLISDTDRVDSWQPALGMLKAIFPDCRFMHAVKPSCFSLWASNGCVWNSVDTLPTPRISHFPLGGIAVARSSISTTASQLILDNGPTSAGHAHKANLTIHWDALGLPAIVDPGRWIYDSSVERAWVVNGESHNTILPLERLIEPHERIKESAIPPVVQPEDPRVGAIEAVDSEDAITFRSSLTGFRIETGARVTREVVVGTCETEEPWLIVLDHFQGTEPHLWTNSWLLPGGEPAASMGGGWRLTLDSGLHLAIAVLGSDHPQARDDAMFWCPNYGEREPARWLRFSSECTSGWRLFAFHAGKEAPSMPLLEHSREQECLVVRFGTRQVSLRAR